MFIKSHRYKLINAQEILEQLDRCSSGFTFPMLDNGYVYPVGTKLTAYRDDERWAIIIEVIGFSYRGGGHNGISNCLHIFGNCLTFEPGTNNENFIPLTDDANDCSAFDEEELFYLNPECKSFTLRDEAIPLPHDRELYKHSGIDLEDEDRVNAFEFLRLLDAQHHHKLVATDNEIRAQIPADIPEILELHHWFHPDVANDEVPSKNETFRQIARVLETGDITHYQPTQEPNTHWSNWAEGGTL